MLVLEFNTEQSAITCLEAINGLATQWWKQQGYTVEDNELIGKRLGVDAPNSQRTVTWDTVKESPDGTWYFRSLSDHPDFPDWKSFLSSYDPAVNTGTEKEMPDSWRTTE